MPFDGLAEGDRREDALDLAAALRGDEEVGRLADDLRGACTPYMRSAAAFHDRIVPSSSFPRMASSAELTMAARKAAEPPRLANAFGSVIHPPPVA